MATGVYLCRKELKDDRFSCRRKKEIMMDPLFFCVEDRSEVLAGVLHNYHIFSYGAGRWDSFLSPRIGEDDVIPLDMPPIKRKYDDNAENISIKYGLVITEGVELPTGLEVVAASLSDLRYKSLLKEYASDARRRSRISNKEAIRQLERRVWFYFGVSYTSPDECFFDTVDAGSSDTDKRALQLRRFDLMAEVACIVNGKGVTETEKGHAGYDIAELVSAEHYKVGECSRYRHHSLPRRVF